MIHWKPHLQLNSLLFNNYYTPRQYLTVFPSLFVMALVLLTKDNLSKSYEVSSNDITQDGVLYTRATVTEGVWILYRYVNFNRKSGERSEQNIVIIKDAVEDHALNWSPAAIYRFSNTKDACTMFEHYYYSGQHKEYVNAAPSIIQDFPVGQADGASSMVIWLNRSWQLNNKVEHQGLQKILAPNWYKDPESMGFPNDSVASIKPTVA